MVWLFSLKRILRLEEVVHLMGIFHEFFSLLAIVSVENTGITSPKKPSKRFELVIPYS